MALGDENAIGVIDTDTLKVARRFPRSDPEAFAVHPNGRIYLSNEDSGKATVLNPDTGKIEAEIQVGIEPEGVAVTPDGKKVMVTSESTNMVHVISVPEHQIVANILVGARPREVAFSEDGRYGYVTCEVGGEVVKFDVETNKIVQRKKLRREIRLVKPKASGARADGRFWIATGRGDLVAVLDAHTLDLEKTIPVGRRVWGMAFSGIVAGNALRNEQPGRDAIGDRRGEGRGSREDQDGRHAVGRDPGRLVRLAAGLLALAATAVAAPTAGRPLAGSCSSTRCCRDRKTFPVVRAAPEKGYEAARR
ncbi:MAG: hypothetical protein R2724_07090 [Bryobacterales bacterium]